MKKTLHRILTALLTTALLLAVPAPVAFGANEQFDFTLTANGTAAATIAPGGTAVIKLTVVNNNIGDDEKYDLYTLQDYICFDRNFFSIDESSIDVMKIPSGGLQVDLFAASAVSFEGSHDRVYVNRSSTSAQPVGKSMDVVSFTLTAKASASGTTTISHDTVEMLSPNLARYTHKDNVATVTIQSSTQPGDGGGGIGGGGGGGAIILPEGDAAPVIVDGVTYDIGTVVVNNDITTVVVDHDALDEQIASARDHVKVPVSGDTSGAAAQFVVNDVEKMAAKNMTLIIDWGDIDYIIPAAAVDTAALDAAFPGVSTDKIPFIVTIAKAPAARNSAVERAVTAMSGQLVLPAINFTVVADYGGKAVEVQVFKKYTAREIEVTQEQARRITTAVVYEPDGTLRHVPTDVRQSGGQWYARVNSLTSSTYALIWNEASFADANGKWYKDVVNEMASRCIIYGRTDGSFDGGANITRAEFAAIVVRSLGLPQNGNGGVFNDVPAKSWYYGTVGKAYEYGIIEGRGSGIFDPQANITRQEAMAMIARAAVITELGGVKTADLSRFSDTSDVSTWANSYVQYNVGNRLIVGNEKNELKPRSNITRAETATVILRLLQNSHLVDVRSKV